MPHGDTQAAPGFDDDEAAPTPFDTDDEDNEQRTAQDIQREYRDSPRTTADFNKAVNELVGGGYQSRPAARVTIAQISPPLDSQQIPGQDGSPQVGDPLDPGAILALFTSGENSPQETIGLLMGLGWSTGRISRAMESVNQPGTAQPGTTQPAPVSQGDLEQPEDFTDLLRNLGVGDITRRFAIDSGVSPDFRNLIQGRAQQQRLPFALEQARSFSGETGERLTDQFTTQKFQEFLSNQGGFQSVGSSLRGAADFLRDRQGEEGDFSAPQNIIRGSLLNLGSDANPNVGSDLFADLIAQAQSRGTRGRTIPGINVGRAVGSSLENVFARDPGRFGRSAPDFIDFLAERGFI